MLSQQSVFGGRPSAVVRARDVAPPTAVRRPIARFAPRSRLPPRRGPGGVRQIPCSMQTLVMENGEWRMENELLRMKFFSILHSQFSIAAAGATPTIPA